jgi:hypothetical protein
MTANDNMSCKKGQFLQHILIDIHLSISTVSQNSTYAPTNYQKAWDFCTLIDQHEMFYLQALKRQQTFWHYRQFFNTEILQSRASKLNFQDFQD